jgi:hypothetical protein
MTDLLTIAETRRALNVSATILWRWEQNGLIQRLPGTRRFTRAEVDRVLQWHSDAADEMGQQRFKRRAQQRLQRMSNRRR